MTKIKIIWRDWYNEAGVAAMTKMGTLPRYDTEIDTHPLDCGENVAAEVARLANENDCESFREGGEIVILEPEQFRGVYHVAVYYEPIFSASESDLTDPELTVLLHDDESNARSSE